MYYPSSMCLLLFQSSFQEVGEQCRWSKLFTSISRIIHKVTPSLGPSLTSNLTLFHPQFECKGAKVSEIMKLGISSKDLQDLCF